MYPGNSAFQRRTSSAVMVAASEQPALRSGKSTPSGETVWRGLGHEVDPQKTITSAGFRQPGGRGRASHRRSRPHPEPRALIVMARTTALRERASSGELRLERGDLLRRLPRSSITGSESVRLPLASVIHTASASGVGRIIRPPMATAAFRRPRAAWVIRPATRSWLWGAPGPRAESPGSVAQLSLRVEQRCFTSLHPHVGSHQGAHLLPDGLAPGVAPLSGNAGRAGSGER